MAFLATPKRIFELVKKLGVKIIGEPKDHGVAIGIGVAEVEPLSHINAFQVFARDGTWYEPTSILEVRDSSGKVLEKFDPAKKKRDGIDPEIAALVRNILTDESTRPTIDDFDWNKLLQLEGFDNGAKTGTSNRQIDNPEFNEDEPEDKKDNPKKITVPGDSWTIGFTPYLVAGVWVGNNRGEPMKSGATGLAVAAPIWKRFMLDAHALLFKQGADREKPYPEIKLETRKINKFSGKLATDFTPPKLVREEVFASFSVPMELDESVKIMEVDKVSGLPVTEYTPFYARRRQRVLNLKSLRPDMPNWNEPVQEWLKKHPRFLSSMGAIRDPEIGINRLRNLQSRMPGERDKQLRDDVHNKFTQKNPPEVHIASPRSGGHIAPGKIDIQVTLSSKFGIREVEFYFDDQLITYTTKSPWTGKLKIPSTHTPGSKHTIRVIAIDQLFNTSEDEIGRASCRERV